MAKLLLLAVLLAACRTSPLVVGGDGGSPDLSVGRVPLVHRATAVVCPQDRPRGGCTAGGPDLGGGGDCTQNSDCQSGINGRCSGSRIGCMCSYDSCFTDADCSAGTTCSCRGTGGDRPSATNHCVTSNCRTDADCGTGGYCSPSLNPTCGSFIGVDAWHCHTPSDSCVNDTDCPADASGVTPFCGYKPELGHFSCLYTICAG